MALNPLMNRISREEGFCWINRVLISDPIGYLDFIKLMADAKVVISDSGGIQEETTILGVPCLMVRPNTERPVTISHGTNKLVGNNKEAIILEAHAAMNHIDITKKTPPLWDGKASQRILSVLCEEL